MSDNTIIAGGRRIKVLVTHKKDLSIVNGKSCLHSQNNKERGAQSMIEKDLPITSEGEDLLHRSQFASRIADMLRNYVKAQSGKSNGIVIGVEGPWGSGKTSLFNLVKQQLDSNLFTVQEFNSWLAVSRETLINLFFDSLEEKISEQDHSLKGKILAWRETVCSSFAPLMPVIGIGARLLGAEQVIRIYEEVQHAASRRPSVRQQQKEIAEALQNEDIKKWIVFFIDDIDRLSNEEIALVFQLVKNIADFPKIIYVLAYDRSVVTEALNSIQRGRGEEYLHKVVQLPIAVPKPQKNALGNILSNQLEKRLKLRPAESVDWPHWQAIYKYVCQEYVWTPRDCARIYNAFVVHDLACGSDCDAGDLLAVTILELSEPKLLSFIYRHAYTLMGRKPDALSWEENPEVLATVARAIEEQFSLSQKPGLKRLLAEMFPSFAEKVRWPLSMARSHSCLISQRICQPEYFERYFQMALADIAVPSEQVLQIFKKTAVEQLEKEIVQLMQEGRLKSFLRQATDICQFRDDKADLVDTACLQRFLEVLSLLRLMKDGPGWDSVTTYEKNFISALLEAVLHQSGTRMWNERPLHEVFRNERISLSILWIVLTQCSQGQKWFWGSTEWQNLEPLVSADGFKQLAQQFLDRIKKAVKQPIAFLRETKIGEILAFWEWLCTQERSTDFESFCKAQKEKLPLALKCIAYVQPVWGWQDASYHVWKWYPEIERILDETVVGKLEKFLLSPERGLLAPEEQKCAAACLILWRKKQEEGRGFGDIHLEASESEVAAKLTELSGDLYE